MAWLPVAWLQVVRLQVVRPLGWLGHPPILWLHALVVARGRWVTSGRVSSEWICMRPCMSVVDNTRQFGAFLMAPQWATFLTRRSPFYACLESNGRCHCASGSFGLAGAQARGDRRLVEGGATDRLARHVVRSAAGCQSYRPPNTFGLCSTTMWFCPRHVVTRQARDGQELLVQPSGGSCFA